MAIYIPYRGSAQVPLPLDQPVLRAHSLTVFFPGTSSPALDKVSVEVAAGGRLALVGANGAGKSTLLKVFAGLVTPREGSVEVLARPAGSCRRQVAYLPQRSELDWKFPISVFRLALTGRYPHLGWFARPEKKDFNITTQVLTQLRLENLSERSIAELSGGQQQRLLVARALIQDADVFLLDEPLNAIDAETRELIAEVLLKLSSQKKTILAATHHVENLGQEFTQTLYLHQGRVTGPDQEHEHGHHHDSCYHPGS